MKESVAGKGSRDRPLRWKETDRPEMTRRQAVWRDTHPLRDIRETMRWEHRTRQSGSEAPLRSLCSGLGVLPGTSETTRGHGQGGLADPAAWVDAEGGGQRVCPPPEGKQGRVAHPQPTHSFNKVRYSTMPACASPPWISTFPATRIFSKCVPRLDAKVKGKTLSGPVLFANRRGGHKELSFRWPPFPKLT
jgi:hypothetical protein